MVPFRSRSLLLMTSSVLLASGAAMADQGGDFQSSVRRSIIGNSYGDAPSAATVSHSGVRGTPSQTQQAMREILLGEHHHGVTGRVSPTAARHVTGNDSRSGDFQASVRRTLLGERP